MYEDYHIGYFQLVVGDYLTPAYTPRHLRVIRLLQKNSAHARKLGRSRVTHICPIDEG